MSKNTEIEITRDAAYDKTYEVIVRKHVDEEFQIWINDKKMIEATYDEDLERMQYEVFK